jgi:hypothetical protein
VTKKKVFVCSNKTIYLSRNLGFLTLHSIDGMTCSSRTPYCRKPRPIPASASRDAGASELSISVLRKTWERGVNLDVSTVTSSGLLERLHRLRIPIEIPSLFIAVAMTLTIIDPILGACDASSIDPFFSITNASKGHCSQTRCRVWTQHTRTRYHSRS